MEPLVPAPDLVTRARAGDRDAFAALYDKTSRALFLYVVGIVGRAEDAEDVLHTTYLAAWERLPALRDAERFPAWLFRIGRNAARDLVRHTRRGPRWSPLPASLTDESARSPFRAAGPDSPLDGLLDGLKPETRALLLLRHGLEWSVEEIAAALAESVPTIRRHLARAESHLRLRHEGRLAHEF
jgi:RNA polymerase sigma factor (sigma-70 family)